MKKNKCHFYKENISKICEILKQKIKGKKTIASLLFKMFECLLSEKETPKRRKIVFGD